MTDIVFFKPVLAELLRMMFCRWQGIRGIPRLLWWSRRLAFPSAPVLVKSPDSLPFVLNREDYGQVMLYYFPYCLELQELISEVVKPGDICLDLGANVGLLTAHMANCAGEKGKVIALEPNPTVFAQLNKMAEFLYPGLIVPVPAGIAEEDGFGSLYLPEGGFSESVEVVQTAHGNGSLVLFSITSVVRQYLHGRVPDFIKIDIEGNEAYLIESISGLLEMGSRPILLVEFHPQKCEQRGVDVAQVIQQLIDLGYQIRRVEKFNKSYHLVKDSMEPIGHDNVLFVAAPHYDDERSFALKWLD